MTDTAQTPTAASTTTITSAPTSTTSVAVATGKFPIFDQSIITAWPEIDLETISRALTKWAENGYTTLNALAASEKDSLISALPTMIDTTRDTLKTDPYRLDLEKSLCDKTVDKYHANVAGMEGLDRLLHAQFVGTLKPLRFLTEVSGIRQQMESEAQEDEEVSLGESVRSAAANENGDERRLEHSVALFGMLMAVPGALPDERECNVGWSGSRETFIETTRQRLEQVVEKARRTVMADDAGEVKTVLARIRKLAVGE